MTNSKLGGIHTSHQLSLFSLANHLKETLWRNNNISVETQVREFRQNLAVIGRDLNTLFWVPTLLSRIKCTKSNNAWLFSRGFERQTAQSKSPNAMYLLPCLMRSTLNTSNQLIMLLQQTFPASRLFRCSRFPFGHSLIQPCGAKLVSRCVRQTQVFRVLALRCVAFDQTLDFAAV